MFRFKLFSLLLGLNLIATPLLAATFTVDLMLDTVDTAPGDGFCDVGPAVPPDSGQCSLRAAIMEAEANSEADTILLPAAATFNLTLAGDGGAEVGNLNISTTIDILGFTGSPPANPALLPRIDATGIDNQHFNILSGHLTLRGLRLTGGNAAFSGGAAQVAGSGSLTAQYISFSNNTADRGGAIAVSGLGNLLLEDSNLFRNDAGNAGGAAIAVSNQGRATIRRSSFLDNRSSSILAATLTTLSSSAVRVENSTFDGTALRPPIAGLEAGSGIALFGAATLIVRNSTLTNYSQTAIHLQQLDGDERVRIANSILQSGNVACSASGTDPDAADVQIVHSHIQHHNNCVQYYHRSVRSGVAELASLSDEPPRLTFSRPPASPLSNVVDRGWPDDGTPSDPDFRCTVEDQRGNSRTLDANLDGLTRCDLGAIEEAPPAPFVVNHFDNDLTDDLPGDGACATVDIAGIGSVCTLRAAVMEANALDGLQYITFEPSATPALLTLPVTGPVGGPLTITDALVIEGQLIDGRPATTIQGQMPGERLFIAQSPVHEVHLRNLALTGGDASGQVGGALVVATGNVTLHRSELFNNSAGAGGGAVAVIGGGLAISDSDFNANQTGNAGAAIFSNGGFFSVINTSFRDHLGFRADGTPIPTIQLLPDTNLQLLNSTFSGNQLAIESEQPDLLFIHQTTFFNHLNGALNISLAMGNDIFITNSIIAAPASPAADCQISGIGLAGDADIDYLLDSDGSCAALATTGLTDDPVLLPLDRGIGHISYRFEPSTAATNPSPALDVAESTSCTHLTDQRHAQRPIDLAEVANLDGACDLGAIEARQFDVLFSDSFE